MWIVMTKYMSVVTVVLILFILSSCMQPARIPPDGIWHSEDPNVTMYLKPEYNLRWSLTPAHFVMNDDVLNVAVSFGPGNGVYMFTDLDINERGLAMSTFLRGNWRMTGEQIRLTLMSGSRERLGYKAIVFTKIETYDPIDLADWIIDEREGLELE